MRVGESPQKWRDTTDKEDLYAHTGLAVGTVLALRRKVLHWYL